MTIMDLTERVSSSDPEGQTIEAEDVPVTDVTQDDEVGEGTAQDETEGSEG